MSDVPVLDALARIELHELAARYGDCIDARDWSGLASVFADDAVYDLRDAGDGVVEGLPAIQEYMATAPRHPHTHLISTISVVAQGDEVVMRSAVTGMLDGRLMGAGRYHDHVVATPQGWRIAHRRFLLVRPAPELRRIPSAAIDRRLLERVELCEADLAIRQLAARYAQAVDARDIEALVELFVADVDCGRWGTGRSALAAFFDELLRRFGRTVHLLGGHVVELAGDRANGTLYCRAEHEVDERWVVQVFAYDDEYVIDQDGCWRFARRRPRSFYADDILQRPGGPDFVKWDLLPPAALPESWPTWAPFWERLTAQ